MAPDFRTPCRAGQRKEYRGEYPDHSIIKERFCGQRPAGRPAAGIPAGKGRPPGERHVLPRGGKDLHPDRPDPRPRRGVSDRGHGGGHRFRRGRSAGGGADRLQVHPAPHRRDVSSGRRHDLAGAERAGSRGTGPRIPGKRGQSGVPRGIRHRRTAGYDHSVRAGGGRQAAEVPPDL